MLYTQEFIYDCITKNQDPFARLSECFGIKSKVYPENGIVILNYDQIESEKAHPVVVECRSLILYTDNWDVASRKFDRFFNHGESPEFYHDFDISRSTCYEKADGSIIGVWHNRVTNTWEISTRGLALGEGDHVSGGTFREKVLSAFGFENEADFQLTINDNLLKEYTYIFEYIGPQNRIVTRYEKDEMVLTGIRNNHWGVFVSNEAMESVVNDLKDAGLNVRLINSYDMNNFDDIVRAAKELPALTEGYVCFDPFSEKRVKIKNPAYVAIHGIRENGALSMKRVYTLVLMNEQAEYLTHFPEDTESFAPATESVFKFERYLEVNWERVCGVTDQKQFALLVKDMSGSGCFFEAKKKGTTPVHVFHEMDINKKLRIFGF